MSIKNKFSLVFLSIGLFISFNNFDANAQAVGISAQSNFVPNPSTILDVSSTTKGILIPRLTMNQRNAINPAANANGLMIYNTTINKFNYWDGTKWNDVGTGSGAVSEWYFGSLDPRIDVPSTSVSFMGKSGDYFYNTKTGKLFLKNSSNIWIPAKTVDDNVQVKFNSTFKTTVTNHVPIAVGANSYTPEVFAVPNAYIGSVITISPKDELPDGIIISYARVKANGEVEVKFANITSTPITLPTSDYYIAITN